MSLHIFCSLPFCSHWPRSDEVSDACNLASVRFRVVFGVENLNSHITTTGKSPSRISLLFVSSTSLRAS